MVTGISLRCGGNCKVCLPIRFLKGVADGFIRVCVTPAAAQGVGFRKQNILLREEQASMMQHPVSLLWEVRPLPVVELQLGQLTCSHIQFQQV